MTRPPRLGGTTAVLQWLAMALLALGLTGLQPNLLLGAMAIGLGALTTLKLWEARSLAEHRIVSLLQLVCAGLLASMRPELAPSLLQAGAARVHSVDTAYGELAWKLRKDPRVVVTERQNALHAAPPPDGVDLVVVDLGWTTQRRLIPAALKWLNSRGQIITLIKPHYEAKEFDIPLGPKGILDDDTAAAITQRVVAEFPSLGVTMQGLTLSPIRGGKEKAVGNAEWLAWLHPVPRSV